MAATLRVIMMAKDGNGGSGKPAALQEAKAGAPAMAKPEHPLHKNGYFGKDQIDAYFRKLGPFLGC